MKQIKNNKKLLFTISFGLVVGLFVSFISVDSKECTEIGDRCYALEVVDDSQSRIQGLSGRESLDKDQGMLFVFDETEKQCMVMRAMNFSLDMVWMDSSRQVVHIEKNVSPDTYPDTFCSSEDTKYVIELNSGQVDESGLSEGDHVMVN